MLLSSFFIYPSLVLVSGFRFEKENAEDRFHLWLFGQNVWGNLARGSTADCPVTTNRSSENKFLLGNGSQLDPASVPQEVSNPFHVCSPAKVGWDFRDPYVTLGATWTHIVENGELYSAGWCGDGACGWIPSIETHRMKGEHAVELVKASDYWPRPSAARGTLRAASAAYTDSLLLSDDGRKVYFIGLTVEPSAQRFIEVHPLRSLRGLYVPEPVLVWEASEGQVAHQVAATYDSSLILLEDGRVLITSDDSSARFGFERTRTKWEELMFPILKGTKIHKIAGNGHTHYAALASDGTIFYWEEKESPISFTIGFKVKDFALGPFVLALISDNGALYTKALDFGAEEAISCGALGRGSGSDLDVVTVMPHPVREVCAGAFYTAGLTESGELYVFGSMEANLGGMRNCKEPSGMQLYTRNDFGGEDVRSITCGYYHMGVLTRVRR